MRDIKTMERHGFTITDEEAMIAQTAADFATRRLVAGAKERDHSGRFPIEQIMELGQMGLLGMKVSTDDGGAGTSNVGYALAMLAIAKACASTAVILASSNLTAKILADHATDAQKERWLAPYVSGEVGPASFALTEPLGGSDAAAVRTSARLDGDRWVIDSEKSWITSASHASFHMVFARTDGEGKKGLSAFIVERGASGCVVGKDEDKMGQRSS